MYLIESEKEDKGKVQRKKKMKKKKKKDDDDAVHPSVKDAKLTWS